MRVIAADKILAKQSFLRAAMEGSGKGFHGPILLKESSLYAEYPPHGQSMQITANFVSILPFFFLFLFYLRRRAQSLAASTKWLLYEGKIVCLAFAIIPFCSCVLSKYSLIKPTTSPLRIIQIVQISNPGF